MTPPVARWRKACSACTRAKRQCSKGLPTCRRCLDRGLECAYPSPRRVESVRVEGTQVETPLSNAAPEAMAGDSWLDTVCDDFDIPLLDCTMGVFEIPDVNVQQEIAPRQPLWLPPGPDPEPGALVLPRNTWFLVPESWKVEYGRPEPSAVFETSILKHYAAIVRNWLRRWVTEGGPNPLVHPLLYRSRMPCCVQEAYTILATYEHKTPATEDTIIEILNQRADQLLHDYGPAGQATAKMDVFDRLARVHALLTYQAIRLFDGNIQMRARAEELIPTLFAWCKDMWEYAGSTLGAGRVSAVANLDPSLNTREGASDVVLWKTWILVESVRRARLVVDAFQHVYLAMRDGFAECSGFHAFTARKELWEAGSAYQWGKLQQDRDRLFAEKHFGIVDWWDAFRPGDVDEFTFVCMYLSTDKERLERWLGGTPLERAPMIWSKLRME